MQYRVIDIISETNDAVTLVLDVSGQKIQYEAGQFITFIFSDRNGKEHRRSYSISSAINEPLAVTIKRVVNGSYSRELVEKTKPGSILKGLLPAGFFTLPALDRQNAIFLFFAAGSGITPVYAQIKSLLITGKAKKIVLVYSNKSKADTIFYEALTRLSANHQQIVSIYFFFSDAPRYQEARLSSSIVTAIVTKHIGSQKENTWVYLCGPFQYMLMLTIVLRGLGLKDEQIRKEQFIIEKIISPLKPNDTAAHTITVTGTGINRSWVSQYPDTILQSAQKNGIELPYSCASGQCGTCSATCVLGKVWMYRNDVLMEEEIRQGRVLTCTGYPVGGDVHLQFP